jgi:hypothetical protein
MRCRVRNAISRLQARYMTDVEAVAGSERVILSLVPAAGRIFSPVYFLM